MSADFLAAKARAVRAARPGADVDRLWSDALAHATRPSLRAALLAGDHVAVIAEYKRRSPSAGGLATAAPAEVARDYAAAGARALSVLTDAEHFGGSLGDLEAVARAVPAPVLRKDFLVDEAGLLEARAAGASAALLIAAMLDDGELTALVAAARGIGIDVLVEAHDEVDVARALDAGALLIGTNNRDLRTLTTDLRTTERLARRVPAHAVLVAESGIRSAADVARMRDAGAHAVLVGESLLALHGAERAQRLRELASVPRSTAARVPFRLKVCGFTRASDAALAAALGVDAIGVVFWPGSPRRVSVEDARALLDGMPAHVARVGVFVDAPAEQVLHAVRACRLDVVQLAGAEPADFVRFVRAETGARVLRVVHVDDAGACARFADDPADFFLLDAPRSAGPGGTGTRFDWSAVGSLPWPSARVVVAGGVGPDNLALALRTVGAHAVDVCSSTEAAPGIKDPARLRAVVEAATAATAAIETATATATATTALTAARSAPGDGWFGAYGGRFVPETLMAALVELEQAFARLIVDPAFTAELDRQLGDYVGRPTPLMRARRLERHVGAHCARIWLKREDLCHTGSHKLNNALGQALLARALGRTRLIAETGAGQHGVASATAAALLGLPCRVYMGAEDAARQHLNVVRMELLGAEVVRVEDGSRTLKDATSAAIRDWMGSYADTHYLIGSVVGPHPYPTIVRTLQRVIGVEARAQMLERTGALPDLLVACVGGGSNALGLFHAFLEDDVAMVGVEAGGQGAAPGAHSASLSRGSPGVLHGARSYLLQDDDGHVAATHSLAAGLDYPAVGPEHAWLRDSGRARYVAVDDAAARDAYRLLARLEGIIPALESAHAVAHALEAAATLGPDRAILVCLSGRGDKDVARADLEEPR